MPVVFRYRGFKFFFYSNEGAPREPIHIHMERDDVEAKVWLGSRDSSRLQMMGTTRGRSVNFWLSYRKTRAAS